MSYNLIGDIGATNCRLKLIKCLEQNKIVIEKSEIFISNNFPSFESILLKFFENLDKNKFPQYGSIKSIIMNNFLVFLGCPGQLNQNNEIYPINLQWGIKCNEIIDKFNFKGFQIINDAETIAFGVLNVEKENLIKINTAEEIPNKTKLIIIPGTGLGTSLLVPQKFNEQTVYYPCSSEFGHSNFAPNNNLQSEFCEFLKKKMGFEYAWTELTVSGQGIINIQDFFFEKYKLSETKLKNEEIFSEALQGNKICQEIVDFFFQLMFGIMSNLALIFLPYSGIYLQGLIIIQLIILGKGSIISYMAKYLETNSNKLNEYFLDKRQILKDILIQIPIYLINDDDLGCKGAQVQNTTNQYFFVQEVCCRFLVQK